MPKKNPEDTLLMRLRRTRASLGLKEKVCPKWGSPKHRLKAYDCYLCGKIFPRILYSKTDSNCPWDVYHITFVRNKLTELINKETAKL